MFIQCMEKNLSQETTKENTQIFNINASAMVQEDVDGLTEQEIKTIEKICLLYNQFQANSETQELIEDITSSIIDLVENRKVWFAKDITKPNSKEKVPIYNTYGGGRLDFRNNFQEQFSSYIVDELVKNNTTQETVNKIAKITDETRGITEKKRANAKTNNQKEQEDKFALQCRHLARAAICTEQIKFSYK